MSITFLTNEDEVVTVVDGAICSKVDKVELSGSTWRQIEPAAKLDEPYLNEWGWKCASNDGTQDLYRWVYRCMYEGFDVPERTIKIGDTEPVTYRVDAGAHAVANINSEGARILRIPLAQFSVDDITINRTLARVKEDNPLLCCPFGGATFETDADGRIVAVVGIAAESDRRAEMREVCMENAKLVQDKVHELYGVSQGDVLSVTQKMKVAKVIHDYLILHGLVENKRKLNALWLTGMTAVFDDRYNGYCADYTQAFNYVARLYGMEAIYGSGMAYIDINRDGDRVDYGENGSHAWVMLRISDEAYGTYPSEPEKWTMVDVLWDEPLHEAKIGGDPERNDILWKYFMDLSKIIPNETDEQYSHAYREIGTDTGYGAYPFEGLPTLSKTYTGDDLYIWNEEDGL